LVKLDPQRCANPRRALLVQASRRKIGILFDDHKQPLPWNGYRGGSAKRDNTLATYNELSAFLAEVERRAYKQTLFAVRDEHVALDVVQESMLKLTEKYSARPAHELPMLFQRIMQNTMRDYFRRQKVRNAWTTLMSALSPNRDGEEHDFLETFQVEESSNVSASPAQQFEQTQTMAIIEEMIESLPARQREAFLLRYWEELDVNETAVAMGCSEGSVKTHCSRAVHALAAKLKARGVTL
jgi:RNA polymerase sigma-70 factor (ECF subfamily)